MEITSNSSRIPNPNLDSPQAAAYRAHKAAEEAFINGEFPIIAAPTEQLKEEVQQQEPAKPAPLPMFPVMAAPAQVEDPNTLVVKIPKAEQYVTITAKTAKGGQLQISFKVLYVEESENAFSLIMSKDISLKLPPLEVVTLTLQSGAVYAVSFLGGEGNIGNCKYLWLIKTDISKLNE